MTEHTKTPWRAGSPHPSNACVYIVDSEGSEIATLYGGSDPDTRDENGNYAAQPIRDAYAAFIFQACNSFDDLVAALKLTLDRITMLQGPDAVGAAEARAALSRAGAA